MIKNVFMAMTALILLVGCARRPPEEELRLTRQRLRNYLFQEESLTQSEMTILSEYILKLADMEQYLIEYRIWNRPGYEKLEKRFKEDCERWRRHFEMERNKPSEFAGGSLEPMDRNLRVVSLIESRIDELKTEWLRKL